MEDKNLDDINNLDFENEIEEISLDNENLPNNLKKELIENLHYIVRHPDMPKAVLKKCSRRLKKEEYSQRHYQNKKRRRGVLCLSQYCPYKRRIG